MTDPLRQEAISPGEKLFLDYCSAPARHWPAAAARQVRKLEKHLKRAARGRSTSTARAPRALAFRQEEADVQEAEAVEA